MTRKDSGSHLAPRGNITTWHPFDTFQQEMERWFDRAVPQGFSAPFFRVSGQEIGHGFAQMDVSETDKTIEVTIDVPGMDEKDLEVTLKGDHLIISGERKTESEKEEKDFHRIERAYGRFERRFLLPCEVKENEVRGGVRQGVLVVTLPKAEKAKVGVKKIAIEDAGA